MHICGMCVCVYVCVHYVHVCMCAYVCACAFAVHVYMCISMCMCVYACLCVYVHVCISVCTTCKPRLEMQNNQIYGHTDIN